MSPAPLSLAAQQEAAHERLASLERAHIAHEDRQADVEMVELLRAEARRSPLFRVVAGVEVYDSGTERLFRCGCGIWRDFEVTCRECGRSAPVEQQ